MTSYDIIPDIHGQAAKLISLLDRLGWKKSRSMWKHADTDRQIIFLGDYIDRGIANAVVLKIVRDLVEAGRARAIMGNHELNAIHFHTLDPETGNPIKPHTERNVSTHQTFLNEFPLGSSGALDSISWFKTLPLWLDVGPFRVVHACWSDSAVERLRLLAPEGVLPTEHLISAGRKGDLLKNDVDLLAKGPEVRLPRGLTFHDGGGQRRDEVRLAWWRDGVRTWREAVVSVPNLHQLPDEHLPDDVGGMLYPKNAKPVFFGHYWMSGPISMENTNAICLDYSAGRDGPLIAYRFNHDDSELSLDKVAMHDEQGSILNPLKLRTLASQD